MSSVQRPMWGATAIGTSYTTLTPTVAAGTQAVLDWITVHNTSTTVDIAVTWYLVPSGGSAGSSTQMDKVTVLANGSAIPQGVRGHIVPAGGSVVAIASAAGCNCAGTGRVQTLS